MTAKSIYRFAGDKLDVLWDQRLCIHVGECGRAEGPLFEGGRKPWCQPDLVDSENAKAVCERCPTGALTFDDKDGGAKERAATHNTINVASRGPLYVRGDLQIDGAADDMESVKFRAALCRCGESNNKPFCDNSHEASGFKDYGAVGQTGDLSAPSGGALKIGRAPNGPLLLSGNVTIVTSSGRVAWKGDKCALCRCGKSNNKPFCDGAHKAAGFTAE